MAVGAVIGRHFDAHFVPFSFPFPVSQFLRLFLALFMRHAPLRNKQQQQQQPQEVQLQQQTNAEELITNSDSSCRTVPLSLPSPRWAFPQLKSRPISALQLRLALLSANELHNARRRPQLQRAGAAWSIGKRVSTIGNAGSGNRESAIGNRESRLQSCVLRLGAASAIVGNIVCHLQPQIAHSKQKQQTSSKMHTEKLSVRNDICTFN